MENSKADWKRPSYLQFEGLRLSVLFKEDYYVYTKNYLPEPDDIIVVSYPKCGSTWCLQMIYLLLNNGEEIPEGKQLHQEYPFMEWEGRDMVEKIPHPRVLKTHLPRDRLTISPHAKYIYVVRNPKDCCVSFYHHTRGFVEDYNFSDGSFGDYYECFIRGEVDWNDYFDHVLSWWPHRNDPNVLFLVYEDMKADTAGTLVKIGNFLGGAAADLVKNEELMAKVLKDCSIDSMRKIVNRLMYDMNGPSVFLRKGVVGDWKNYFTKEQSLAVDARMKEKFAGTGIIDIWKSLDVWESAP